MIFDVDHDALMVHFAVGTCEVKINRAMGYIDRLKAAIDAGDAIGPAESVARMLDADVRSLTALADTIAQIRTALIENGMPRLQLVAAE
jgi:hypothetical protein